jgi:hypothetical protein
MTTLTLPAFLLVVLVGPSGCGKSTFACRILPGLRGEGFHQVHVFATPEEADAAIVGRRPLWCDRRDDHGPFDIIGDVHGCFDELAAVLARLGYEVGAGPGYAVRPPAGRKAVFPGFGSSPWRASRWTHACEALASPEGAK